MATGMSNQFKIHMALGIMTHLPAPASKVGPSPPSSWRWHLVGDVGYVVAMDVDQDLDDRYRAMRRLSREGGGWKP